MRDQFHRLLLLLLLSLLSLLSFGSITQAKSVIEPCSSSDSCNSLLSYLLPWDSKLSEIASRFQVNISDILATNSMDPTRPSSASQIIPAKSLVKVPILCPCVDGIRRSLSTTYTVKAADTMDLISEGFGGLVSADQIRSVNGGKGAGYGQSLVIPLPCTCFGNTNNGATAVYMSYVVQRGESLGSIGARYHTTVTDLAAVNGLGQPVINPGDILAIPIPACSSANLRWYNESLIVANGSYALTANNCIRCSCTPTHLNLQCFPSGIMVACNRLQCKASHLFIGDVVVTKTPAGCNITTCVYRGHGGRKIFRSLVNSSHVNCSGNESYWETSPMASPSPETMFPSISLSPSPSPFSAPSPFSVFGAGTASDSRSNQTSNSSSGVFLSLSISCFSLLILQLVTLFILK